MPGRERGLLHGIVKSFIASFRPHKHKLIGEDYYGTKYYEVQRTNASRRKSSRYFIPVNKTDHEQELPVEWEAWLRYRRKYPPSAEEIQQNYESKLLVQQNAAQIKETFENNESKEIKSLGEKAGHSSFPIYDEYEDNTKYKKTN